MSISHGGVFNSTAQHDLKLQGQAMALLDAIPKNPTEAFVASHNWKGDKQDLAGMQRGLMASDWGPILW